MPLVNEKCAEILGCKVSALRDRLNHPIDRARVLAELTGRTVRTTYMDNNGFRKIFTIDGLSLQGADSLMAFGRLPRPFAVSVAGYYYCKRGIRLKYPFTCCIIERFQPEGEDRYFPLELLELIEPAPSSKLPTWIGRGLFTEVGLQVSSSNDNNSGDYISNLLII